VHHVIALIALLTKGGDVTRRCVVEAMGAARIAGVSRMAIAIEVMEKR
jgi:hypothetical protein